MTCRYLFSIMLLICVATAAAKLKMPKGLKNAKIAAAEEPTNNCPYEFMLKTGDKEGAGTNALINLVFGFDTQFPHQITDLQEYGTTGPDHVYFQRGQFDTFVFRGPCNHSHIYPLNLQKTKRGDDPDWYVDFFIISASLSNTGLYAMLFPVYQWLNGTYATFPVTEGNGVPMEGNTPTAASLLGLAMPS